MEHKGISHDWDERGGDNNKIGMIRGEQPLKALAAPRVDTCQEELSLTQDVRRVVTNDTTCQKSGDKWHNLPEEKWQMTQPVRRVVTNDTICQKSSDKWHKLSQECWKVTQAVKRVLTSDSGCHKKGATVTSSLKSVTKAQNSKEFWLKILFQAVTNCHKCEDNFYIWI